MTVEVTWQSSSERLELYTAIDHNLILHSRVVSLNKGSEIMRKFITSSLA